ncbi:dipeptidase PepV [Massilicoli timonensis]|uniref:dipeptidase PepV n=2 Tax=Massilicoli timonensis TaxID=2015901 RepID=UPI0023F15686|nr:dipeptidase PepV [Massilicoli timonensis]
MNWKERTAVYENDLIKDLQRLLAVESVKMEARPNAPFGLKCREALDEMLAMAKRDGFAIQDIDGYAGVITYGEGEESVGVLGHLDIVPIGDGWSRDPYGSELVDGVLFGRGALDDKGPGMAAYYALKAIKDAGIKLKRKVMLIYGCDEESGMACMKYYREHGEIPTMGFVPDANFPLIYGEKGIYVFTLSGKVNTVIQTMEAGSRPNIVIGKANATVHAMSEEQERLFSFYLKSHQLNGNLRREADGSVRIYMEGKPFHAMAPFHGVNAGLHLLNFIGAAYDDAFARAIYALFGDWQGSGLGIAAEGARMGFLTLNTGVIEIKEGQVKIVNDIRYPIDVDAVQMKAQIAKQIEAGTLALTLAVSNDSAPLYVDPKSELVSTLEAIYRKHSGDETTPIMTIGGGTYARNFDQFVAYGPELPNMNQNVNMKIGGPHQEDEGIQISDLMMAMAIYAESIAALAGETA